MNEHMRREKGGDVKQRRAGFGLFAVVLICVGFFSSMQFFPHSAIAWPSKFSSCTGCHSDVAAGAAITVGINGTQTSAVTVAAGGTFEVDYFFTNLANGYGVGVEVAVPSGWTVAKGTANATGLTGWNTAWNLSDGVSAWSTSYSTSKEYSNSPAGYTLDFNGTSWDTGNRDSAYDNGTAGQDLDLTANRMGTDVRITVPAGTPAGSYQVVVAGLGHDSGGAKANVSQVITVTVPAATSTTVGNGTNPGNATLVPGGALTDLDSFTLNTSSGTDTVTGLTVSLAAGTAAGISSVTITNDAGTTTYGTVTNPASDTVTFATLSTSIPVTTTATQYHVRIQPKTHANMPAVPGASYAVTGTVTAITCTNAKVYNDSSSATLTIDNLSPSSPSAFTGTPSSTQVALSWTNPADADFSQVIVLRKSGSAITDTPVEGTTYTAPGTLGSSSIIYVGSAGSYTDTGLTNGTAYYYKVFAKDSNGNYSSGGTAAGPYTPSVAATTSLGNGLAGTTGNVCPATTTVKLDGFSLSTSSGTDTVTGLTVTTTGQTAITSMQIWNEAGTTQYFGTVSNPGSNTWTFSGGTPIPVTTTSSNYKVVVTYDPHSTAPAGNTSTTAYVSAYTSTNSTTGVDSTDTTVTLNNTASTAASWGSTSGGTSVSLAWTNGSGGSVMIVRYTANTDTTMPTEGTAYTVSSAFGTGGTVIYVGTGTSTTDSPAAGTYYYRSFAYDTCQNYAATAPWTGALTVSAACTANTPTLTVAPAAAAVVAGAGVPYTATVTNNDSAACGNVTFNLSLTNSNTTNFSITAISPSSVSVAPSGQGTATFTVTAGAAAPDGAQNISTVGVTAAGHASPANVTATTIVNSNNSPLMHSGANLGTKYANGTWGIGKDCSWCHISGDTANIKLINNTIDTPNGIRSVVFNRLTAAATAATGILGNDERTVKTVSTNVCEVCHHSTDFHQYSSVTKPSGKSILSITHNNRTDCTSSCHPHSAGFKGSGCNGCHGAPPTTTAIGGPDGLASPATGALGASPTNAGAHNAHVNALSMTCYTCHTGNTMPTVSNSIQMGFAVNAATWPAYRGNSITYGSFSGHTPLNAPYGANGMVSSSAGTLVNNSASYRNSCNVYCHGQWAGSNGSLNPSWIITNGTQDACGTCHSTSQATYAAGSHQRHTGTVTGSGQLNLACTECHGTLPANNSHVNGQVYTQLNTANTKFGSSATYKGFANQSSAAFSYGSCSVYCHSAVQNSTGTALVTPTSTPNWGTAGPLTCSTSNCHGNPPANNAHAVHTGAPYNYACSACHTGAGQGTASHANYAINMAINATYGATATYTAGASVTPGSAAAFGTCNSTICHGQRSPVWASPTTPTGGQCVRCHGSKATAFGNFSSPQVAPGYSTDGVDTGGNNTASSARVGTHQAHLQATDSFTDKIHCGECHTVVTTVAQASHLNYSTATMTFGAVAKAQSHTPTVTRAGGVISCSTTYCHTGKLNSGAAPTPAWNNTAYLPATISLTACGQCHGFPPSTGSGHPAATAPSGFPVGGNCNCHTNLSTTGTTYGTIFTDRTKHVNGAIEYTTSCKGCHGTGAAKDVQTEFARNSHHTNKVWANITDADCVVCHAEGTIAAGTVNTAPSRHGGESGTKGVVDLYNADNRATIYTITVADLTNRLNAANATLDTFCMSCHDSGGAAAITTGNGFTGGNTATNPFNDTTLSNSYDQQTRTFGAAPAPLNVYDAFAPTNNSHHAVRGARYTKTSGLLFGQSLTQAGLLSTTAANYSGGTGFTDMSVMHCNDCHSTAFSAHGGNNEYLLQTATSENPTAEHASDTEYVCLKCHPNYTGGGNHTGSGSDFIYSADLTGTARSNGNNGHITGIACLNCHDGAVGFGGVHGVPNASYTAGVNGSGQGTYNKRRFLPGSGLRYYDPSATHTSSTINDDGTWGEATATNQCYTLGTANTTSSCTKHGSKAAGQNVRNVRRPVTY